MDALRINDAILKDSVVGDVAEGSSWNGHRHAGGAAWGYVASAFAGRFVQRAAYNHRGAVFAEEVSESIDHGSSFSDSFPDDSGDEQDFPFFWVRASWGSYGGSDLGVGHDTDPTYGFGYNVEIRTTAPLYFDYEIFNNFADASEDGRDFFGQFLAPSS